MLRRIARHRVVFSLWPVSWQPWRSRGEAFWRRAPGMWKSCRPRTPLRAARRPWRSIPRMEIHHRLCREFVDGAVRALEWRGVDSENVAAGDQPTLKFNAANQPTVLFNAIGKGEIRASPVTRSGSSWASQVIDAGAITDRPALAYDTTGNPSTLYMKAGKGQATSLIFARRIGSTWVKETVDGSNTGTGLGTTLAYDLAGNPSTGMDTERSSVVRGSIQSDSPGGSTAQWTRRSLIRQLCPCGIGV